MIRLTVRQCVSNHRCARSETKQRRRLTMFFIEDVSVLKISKVAEASDNYE
jgi:hypothetical protein